MEKWNSFSKGDCTDLSGTGRVVVVACSQFEVRDVVWEEGLGAGQLDLLLTQHFANEFKSKTGQDISAQPKAIAKLKRQVCSPLSFLSPS